ncbi:sigma-70 family RNA polymerase sigma factor [Alicyclobacillus tolerans]|uniref:sigma-70 family RNA polymerase sigma factor n=1 Tax=Alicyclobacillus tolerans TaxID=90970 RepID=UPI001F23AA81|nr:sigma-70 family RNA polymerase sigma factor [Alicyclobacillus tolerans]MCF8567189.1 sigma-70 family RNA polymerase sigma factor [Alicyclobacillus tolerans]
MTDTICAMEGRVQEEALIRLAQNGSQVARDNLCKQYEPLIRATARRYQTLSFTDAVQEGYAALLSAIAAFDPAQQVPFPAFAASKVRGDVRTAMRRLWRYNERIAPPPREHGDGAGRSPDALEQVFLAGGAGGSGMSGFETGATVDAFNEVEWKLVLETSDLSSREILSMQSLMAGESCTSLARRMGVSVETVKTWRKRGLRKLRKALREWRGLAVPSIGRA